MRTHILVSFWHICMYAFLILSVYKVDGQNKPVHIYSIIDKNLPYDFYTHQAQLWWAEVQKDQRNDEAWYNYYKACRYSKFTFNECQTPECTKLNTWNEGNELLKNEEDIIELINKHVPNTFIFYYVQQRGLPHSNERIKAIEKAYALKPEATELFSDFTVYYEVEGDVAKRKVYNTRWYNSQEFSPGLLHYSYNVLMSLSRGGVLLTFGDNDSFPIWILQDVLGIRTDVTVFNVPLLSIPTYRERLFNKHQIAPLNKEFPDGATEHNQKVIIDHILDNKPEALPLYVGIPSWKQLAEQDEHLYLTGLVLEYSSENLDDIARLRYNFEQAYALDYLETYFTPDIRRSVVDQININYLPGMIKLFEHYKLAGEKSKAQEMSRLGMLVATRAGKYWKEKAIEAFKE